jgi:hypothetical protein
VKLLRIPAIAFALLALVLTGASGLAANDLGKLTGVIADPAGTPQMGATVWLTPEYAGGRAIQLLTDENGIFVSQRLRPGLYSVKVTLAGFFPSVQEHVSVAANLDSLVHIELNSILISLDRLRRPSSKSVESDDWKWVLRTASSSRPVLQLRDGTVIIAKNASDESNSQPRLRTRVELTNGSVRPGSASALPGALGTAVSYDQGLGQAGKLLIAGEVNYDQGVSGVLGGSVATVWLPSGKLGEGPQTTLVMRQIRIGDSDRSIRSMRIEHSEQMAIGDHLVMAYGGEYLSGGLVGELTSSVRPHARVGMHFSPRWEAALSLETDADAYGLRSRSSGIEPAMDALQTAPLLVWGDGHPVLSGGWHEELAVRHAVRAHDQVEMAVFRDDTAHQAIYGVRGDPTGPSSAGLFRGPLAHDAGSAGFSGTRVVYRHKLSDNLEVAGVYAWAGALAPNNQLAPLSNLGEMLQDRYHHSVAARVAGQLARSKTKFAASYKWVDGTVVNRQDLYGESSMAIDPNLSLSIRQPLPSFLMVGHWEASADFRNMLAQGYVSLEGQDGRMLVMPVERSFRGGVSFQF